MEFARIAVMSAGLQAIAIALAFAGGDPLREIAARQRAIQQAMRDQIQRASHPDSPENASAISIDKKVIADNLQGIADAGQTRPNDYGTQLYIAS